MSYPSYSELLSAYIEESGMTLGEIAKKLQDEKGVKIDRSYISMLKNNKTKNPASDEINRALAEATGGDAEKLIYAAYVEKAPEEMKSHLQMVGDVDYVLYRLLIHYGKYLTDNDLVTESDYTLHNIVEMIDEYDSLALAEKMELLESVVEDAKDRNIDPVKVYSDSFPKQADEVSKEAKEEYLRQLIPALTIEPNKWFPPFLQELKEFTKKHKGPKRFITTPNNLIYLLSENLKEYHEFIDKLMFLLVDAVKRYESVGFRHPGFNPNVKIKLDEWLERGNLTYRGIDLTDNDKSLMSIYVEALLKDRLVDESQDID